MTDLQALPDNHILTADDAAWLMEQGACDRALRYIGHTVAVAAMSAPWSALRYAAARLSDEQFAAAARADPEAALRYATDRLSDEQFAAAVRAKPWAALRYAAARLSDEQFAAAARADPEAALEHARDRYAALLGKDTAPDAS